MAGRRSSGWVPEKVSLSAEGVRQERARAEEELRLKVLEIADEIFDRYIFGESMQFIADSLPFKIAGWKLRKILLAEETTRETFEQALLQRSHNLIEASVDYGRCAAAIGDASGLKVAIDTNMKVAAKLNPAQYGDTKKVELTGKDGRALEVKADLTLTAEQAYERLIKGE